LKPREFERTLTFNAKRRGKQKGRGFWRFGAELGVPQNYSRQSTQTNQKGENVAIQEKTVKYAKELDDVGVLLVSLVETIKEKKDVTSNVDELIAAINGIDQVDDEIRENLRVAMQTMGYRLMEIPAILFAPKAVPVPA